MQPHLSIFSPRQKETVARIGNKLGRGDDTRVQTEINPYITDAYIAACENVFFMKFSGLALACILGNIWEIYTYKLSDYRIYLVYYRPYVWERC